MGNFSRIVVVLRRFRELAGITQKEMAIKTGVSLSTIQRIEAGTAEMKISHLESYMKVLEITLIDIEIAVQKRDFVLDKEIAAAARLLPLKKRKALLRFINDMND